MCLPRGPKLPGQKGNTVHRETATNCLPSRDNRSLRALVHRNICLTKDSRKAINISSDRGCKEMQYSISTAPARPHIGPGESGGREVMPGRSGRHAKWLHFLLHSGNFDSRHDLSPTETTTLKSNFLDLKAGSAMETQFGNHIPP